MGKYLTIPRTEGISTTDIVGRMLLMTKSHHNSADDDHFALVSREDVYSRKSNFLTTSTIINLFASGVKAPRPDDIIVYLAGAWDMFHTGHVEILKKAREFGTYVIVGVHNDNIVNARHGQNFPILNQRERVLSVLGCRYVDDVLFDAPYIITEQLLATLKIAVVVTGTSDPTFDDPLENEKSKNNNSDPFCVPKQKGILHELPTSHKVSVKDIVERTIS